jgi:NDP-sugar pyrophosphorylase family protein
MRERHFQSLQVRPPDAKTAAFTCRALVMAGGRSERMRATSGFHKALMLVGGKALIERNLQALFDEGFQDIVVTIGSQSPEIEAFIGGRGCELASSAGAALTCLKEAPPLGTIGAAGITSHGSDALLVVNVDNLTTLPLRRFVKHHRKTGAALTIASHREPFQIPFGQLIIRDGEVLEYLEKPLLPIPISSGAYVLSPQAAELIEPDRRFDITDLFRAAKAKGLKISAFEHDCAWIDINDESSLRRAEGIFAKEGAAG